MDYSQLFDKRVIPILMRVLSVIAVATFVSFIYSGYYISILWSEIYGYYRAFMDIWLPTMPYGLYWFCLIIFGWKDWRIILWGFPLVSFEVFNLSFWYVYHYHTNMGSFYYPGQALALLQIITMTLGMILLLLHIWVRYLKYKRLKLQ